MKSTLASHVTPATRAALSRAEYRARKARANVTETYSALAVATLIVATVAEHHAVIERAKRDSERPLDTFGSSVSIPRAPKGWW